MSNLTILKTFIREHNGLLSLNDLHQASGSDKNHQPSFFIRNEKTQDLIKEIQGEDKTTQIYLSLRTGMNKGSWACEELAIAYAA
ncbi:hypothetical protein A4G19_13795 [Pasteurellaceae bacterium Macca]|nr:hypothetical protein [Pasteurellaceae bacterium Macca]MCK3656402.1 hypothetical protein [Pasteurellaceae bacterium Macca]MCK3656751.1 hypothetical protein [Pasteurellaceae bacterium Macca]